VSASVALWIVSASSATDPDATTIASCTAAVVARIASEIHVARTPSRVAIVAASAGPKCS